jgi:hypothetical protein
MENKVRRFWSEEEICFLKENYPKNGGIFCAQHLCRTLIAVQGKAMVIGLRQSSEQKSIIRKREGINKDYNSYDVNPMQFLKIDTSEIAYILGLLWSDGYVNKKTNAISISIKKEDFDKIKHIFKKTGNWRFYDRKPPGNRAVQTTAHTSNSVIKNFLSENDYLVKSNNSADKILNKIPNNLKHYFFRGVVDGDGCFYVKLKTDKNKVCRHCSIGGTLQQDWGFLEKLFNKKLKIKFSIERTTRENGKYSKVMLTNKESIESFGNYIYEGFPKDSMGLKRKYEKFIGILKSYSLK